MAKGRIISLNNNYGYIYTDSYHVENEEIPFEVVNSMLIEKDGKQYIKYTEEVEFTLKQRQGVRDRDIKEAVDIKFIGDDLQYKERVIENNIFQIIRNRLNEYNFLFPDELNDRDFAKWLSDNNFQPRMLEYLIPGMFVPKEEVKIYLNSIIGLNNDEIDLILNDNRFEIERLFLIDRIDIEFRKYILSWVTGIENAYKTYFVKISISEEGQNLGEEVIQRWTSKRQKAEKQTKQIKRARNKRLYRDISDEFDYLAYENSAPLLDFMEQLELKELNELINIFYDIYLEKGRVPEILQKMKECLGFIRDLSALRNAAAHGRSILPLFMDPDYNGNWDLEFDNIENRSKVESWLLFDLLKRRWEIRGLGKRSKEIVNLLYGNPIRRAWIELNYLYFYIIRNIEESSFDLFIDEALWFLGEEDVLQQVKNVNLLNLRLSDIGETTYGIPAPPADEISMEAFAVWELFET